MPSSNSPRNVPASSCPNRGSPATILTGSSRCFMASGCSDTTRSRTATSCNGLPRDASLGRPPATPGDGQADRSSGEADPGGPPLGALLELAIETEAVVDGSEGVRVLVGVGHDVDPQQLVLAAGPALDGVERQLLRLGGA